LKAEPVLISQLVRAAGISLAVDALNQVVNRTTLSLESLTGLSKALQNMEDYDARGEGFNRGMAFERVTDLDLLGNPNKATKFLRDLGAMGTTEITGEQLRRMVEHLKQSGSLKAEHDYLEISYQQLLSAHKEAFPDRLKTADLIRQLATEATNQGLPFCGWNLPHFAGAVSREARCLANLRLALTAVALEQFRAAHNNRYPASFLSELTPNYLVTILTDPFDGQPLRYRKQGDGYVLYSIGPDLKDDGGKPMNGKNGDIVFTVITPPEP
jgi:hypothetical protein